MHELIQQLLDSDLTHYEISKKSGVDASIISNLRSGKRTIDNISLKNAAKLADYYEGVLKMQRTAKQEENLRKSAERMRISDNSKILSDAAFDLNAIFEEVQMNSEQRKLMTNAIGSIQKVRKEIAYDK